MKVLLIGPYYRLLSGEPEYVTEPLGLCYLEAVLESRYEIKILDCVVEGYEQVIYSGKYRHIGLLPSEVKNRIEHENPDVVGISALFFSQATCAHEIAKIAKEIDEDIVVVLGGAYPSSSPEMVLKDKNVDFVVRGEGEVTFSELVEKIEKGEDVYKVRGIAYQKKGEIVLSHERTPIKNLDDIPFPARHLVPFMKYQEMWLKTARKPVRRVLKSFPSLIKYYDAYREMRGHYPRLPLASLLAGAAHSDVASARFITCGVANIGCVLRKTS